MKDFLLTIYQSFRDYILNNLLSALYQQIISDPIEKLQQIVLSTPNLLSNLLSIRLLEHTSLMLKSDLLPVITDFFNNIIKQSKAAVVELVMYR